MVPHRRGPGDPLDEHDGGVGEAAVLIFGDAPGEAAELSGAGVPEWLRQMTKSLSKSMPNRLPSACQQTGTGLVRSVRWVWRGPVQRGLFGESGGAQVKGMKGRCPV